MPVARTRELETHCYIHVVLAAPLVFLVQYLTYTVIVFIVLVWRANP